MELFKLPILKSGDLNLTACAFKFLTVLLLCCNILFYFNLYSSLAVTNKLCIQILLNINIEKVKIKAFQLMYSIYSQHCQAKLSSVIFFKYLHIIWKQKLEKLLVFLPGLNTNFHGLKKKKNHIFTFIFSDIVSVLPSLSLSRFLTLFPYVTFAFCQKTSHLSNELRKQK